MAALQPQVRGVRYRNAGAIRRMNTFTDLDAGLGPECIGLLFALECFKPALAILICVIDNPGFLLLTGGGLPGSLANVRS